MSCGGCRVQVVGFLYPATLWTLSRGCSGTNYPWASLACVRCLATSHALNDRPSVIIRLSLRPVGGEHINYYCYCTSALLSVSTVFVVC